MTLTALASKSKTVGDPCASYDNAKDLWARSRAVCNGERTVKYYDSTLDTMFFTNLLIPFSPTMTEQQYAFYKAEAELPGIVAQYSRVILGGLLRKPPQLVLPEDVEEGAYEWLMDSIGQDGSSIVNFLYNALWEEIQTSRAWIIIDHPFVDGELSPEEKKEFKPYPVLWFAEDVINWKVSTKGLTGASILEQLIVRTTELDYTDNEFHPDIIPVVYVHELINGEYQIRRFVGTKGQVLSSKYIYDTTYNPKFNGEPINEIPAWPLNGCIEPQDVLLAPLIDREISLYNKVSRRNHLMYGAATYTPYIASNMSEDQFDQIVESGLGSWLRLAQGDTIGVLDTPTAALADMDRAIKDTVEEMAKLGVRMLAPESNSNNNSGIALEIRNAAQSAQLGSLNTRVSATLSAVIAFMLNWRYNKQYTATDIQFTLSADFNPAPLGADWLRLVTEWYQQGLIPRSVWLEIGKQNDVIPNDYDDNDGQEEINSDEIIVNPREQAEFSKNIEQEMLRLKSKTPKKE